MFVVTPAIMHNSYACPRKTQVSMENHTLDYILNYTVDCILAPLEKI